MKVKEKTSRMKTFFKKYKWPIASVTVVLLLWSLCFKMISPGYVGVVVNLFGEKKGAQIDVLKVGMHWIAPWKNVYEFPIFEQNHIWEKTKSFTFQTNEGLSVNADIGISYHLDEDKIHVLFAKYRRGIEEITDLFIRNYARDAINKFASKMKIEDLYGTEKEHFMEEIQHSLKNDLLSIGIIIDRVYLIGNVHFPQQVVTALNAKIEATQRAQQRENELRESEAQAKKEIAIEQGKATSQIIAAEAKAQSILLVARTQAEANNLLSKSLSSQLLTYKAIEQWDGKLPGVMTSDITPFFDIRK